jgi:hypothetical protein
VFAGGEREVMQFDEFVGGECTAQFTGAPPHERQQALRSPAVDRLAG